VNVIAPDLTAVKTNNATNSTTIVNNPFNWTITVSNGGTGAAVFADGQTILTDDLPSGATYGSLTAGSFINVINSANVSCDINSNVLTCKASGAAVTISAAGSFEVSFQVTPTVSGSLVNPAQDGSCKVDPNSNVTETNENNNTCSDTVTVNLPQGVAAVKTNNVNGQVPLGSSFTWTIQVSNLSQAPVIFADGQKLLTDNLPTGATYQQGALTPTTSGTVTGTISCSLSGTTLTCAASGGPVTLQPSASFSVGFLVTPTQPGALVNPANGGVCKADPDNVIEEINEENNNCSDTVNVLPPDLTALKTNDTNGTILFGGVFNWTIKVTNNGQGKATFDQNEVVLKDNLPTSGATYGTPNVDTATGGATGTLNCAISANVLTCTATSTTFEIAATKFFTVSIPVTTTAVGSLVNPANGGVCKADPDNNINESGEGGESNNNCGDTVAVTGTPDLEPKKTNNVSGQIQLGQTFVWTITTTNKGTAPANFSNTQEILKDVLPNGASYQQGSLTVTPSGITGTIVCSLSGTTLTCTANGAVSIPPNASFAVSFNATPQQSGNFSNAPRPDGTQGCADPNGNVGEDNENNNDCPDTIIVNVIGIPCKCIHIWSKESSVTLKPGKTGTINLNIFVQAGFPITITNLTPKVGQPFEIVSIKPGLPKQVPGFLGLSIFKITVRLLNTVTNKTKISRPYFDIASDPVCEQLQEWGKKPKFKSLLDTLIPADMQTTLLSWKGQYLLLDASSLEAKSVRLQLFDLKGRLVADRKSESSVLALLPSNTLYEKLANGVYLYRVQIQRADGKTITTAVQKIVIRR
jgi:uncharacterized repeat protein (TIGR01451 family)